MATTSWNSGAACSCPGRAAALRRSVPVVAPQQSPSRHTATQAFRGGAVLEREAPSTSSRRVEEVHPTSFELFTTTDDDAWAREFAEFSRATQGSDDLASLQAELMSTVATIDSMLLAPLPSTSGKQDLDPEARRAKRQQARAARKKTTSPGVATTAVASATALVLEPPAQAEPQAPRRASSRALQPPSAAIPQLGAQRQELELSSAVQQQQQQQPALGPMGLSLAPAAARTTTRRGTAPAPPAAAAALSAPGLALPQQQQQQPAPGLALPAPAAVSARTANQARASRNSAGRTAVGKDGGKGAQGLTGATASGLAGDGIGQFFKMTSNVGLLKPDQQKEVANVVKDYLSLKSIERELMGILKRPPTTAEWAKAVKMDPMAFQVRLQRGQDAKALMLKANYRLVVKVVKPYQNRGLSLQDLITEGMHGLVKAVEKFEADKGFRFSTYAHWWIRQAVTRAVQEQGRAVRLPTHLHEQIVRITMASTELNKKLARQPTMAEIGQAVGMPADKVAEILAAARPSNSLEVAAVGGEDDGAAEAKDQLADDRAQPDEVLENDNLASSIEATLAQALTPREAGILRMHWGLDGRPEMTLEEIGAHFGVTRERVRQVEARAMRKLKECQLALPAGVLGELQSMSTLESDGTAARASRGTKKT